MLECIIALACVVESEISTSIEHNTDTSENKTTIKPYWSVFDSYLLHTIKQAVELFFTSASTDISRQSRPCEIKRIYETKAGCSCSASRQTVPNERLDWLRLWIERIEVVFEEVLESEV